MCWVFEWTKAVSLLPDNPDNLQTNSATGLPDEKRRESKRHGPAVMDRPHRGTLVEPVTSGITGEV